MSKEIVRVNISDNFKEKAMELSEYTIKNVFDNHEEKPSDKDINKIKNLSLDQINVNITNRAKLKTLWVLNVEKSIPIIVEKEQGIPELGGLLNNNISSGKFQMKPNLSWTHNKENKDGYTKEEFESIVKKMLLEDIETASFYGALSYINR